MGLGQEQDYSISMTQTWIDVGDGAFYGTAFMANGVQLGLSLFSYFSNALFTSMFISHYWGKFIYKAQRLRVSVPKGAQKSSFFLSLPYRYSLPLLVCSILLHWLLSQSLFVIQTRGFYYTGQEDMDAGFARAPSLDASVLGYSAIGQVLSLALITVLFICLIFFGLRNLPSRSFRTLARELDEDVIRMLLVFVVLLLAQRAMGIMRMKIHILRQSNGSKSRGGDGLLNARSSRCLVSSVYYPIHLDLTRKSISLKDTPKGDDSSMIGDYCVKSSMNLWLLRSYDVLIWVAHF